MRYDMGRPFPGRRAFYDDEYDRPPRRGGPGGWSGGFPGGEERGIHGPARYGYGPYHERLRSRRRPDDQLREEVEEALFYDTWVDAEAITVEVENGVVTLSGELPDYDEVRLAVDDAWDVEGVIGVRPRLRVAGEDG